MLSVSEKYLQSIVSDTRDMPYRVTLGGALVLGKAEIPSMSINENVGGNEGVVIGSANSTMLNFTLKDAEVTDYDGMLVEPESGLVLPDGSTEWLPLGKFWVTDFTTSNDFKTVKFTCADGMYHMTGDYVSVLTYPAHIRDVTHEIVAQSGVEFEEPASWPEIYVRRKPEGLTHREAIGYAAGCCGSNARFNRYGKLEFTWYNDSGITLPREVQYLDGLTKLNYKPLEVNFEITGQQELYEVTVISDGNGGITATPGQNIIEDETVVLSVNPFSNYELATITAVTESGEEVTLYQRAEGGYTFIQPDSNVTITASFRQKDTSLFQLTVRAYDNGRINHAISAAENEYFEEGEIVTLFVYPDEGYEIDKFVTTPSNITLAEAGTTSTGGLVYEFEMPQSDVTINAYFKAEAVYYKINRLVADDGGLIFVQDNYTGDFIADAAEGTVVAITFSPETGYAFDYYDSDVTLTQVGSSTYTFTMPPREVSITAHYKLSEDESKTGVYSWLQMPQSPPISKPYWAVFYGDSTTLPTCQKYYLIWFDSWKATGYTTTYGKREYSIQFEGYYFCGSKNNGNGAHEWDTSTWSGNGASGSTLEWDACVDFMWSDGSTYGPNSQYCLLASNIHLFYNSSLIMEKCENAIQEPQISYVQDGMDVREKGSLTYWKCPDTFSTPAPASNWMILMPDNGLYLTIGEDGKYDGTVGSSPDSMCILFFDSISIQNVGAVFSDALVGSTDEEFYIASVTNGHWAYVSSESSNWGTLYDIPDGAVIGFRNPLISTNPVTGTSDGNYYLFNGILATSTTLYVGGSVFKYNNACRVCDCVSEVAEVAKFSLRSTPIAEEETEKVTISYTNPMIYEKMVEPISALVQGVTYTPSALKYRGNPALQAGDIVTVPDKNGVNHTILIMQQTMNFGGGMNAQITCPGKTEKTKSFSSVSPISAQIKKEVQRSNVELEKRLAENNALVFNSMYTEIGKTESKIKSVVEWQSETDSTIAKIEQTADKNSGKIALVVGQNGIVNEDGAVQGSVVIEAINGESEAKIAADRIELEGKKLDIKVDATNIEGEITAKQINAEGLNVKNGTFSGDLSAQMMLLQDCLITIDSDNEGEIKVITLRWSLSQASSSLWRATATASEPLPESREVTIYFLVSSGYYNLGKATMLAGNDTVTFTFSRTGTQTGNIIATEYLTFSSDALLVSIGKGLMPSKDSTFLLGTANKKWGDIYSATGTINTSDEREKNSMSEIPQKYSDMFYKLKPIIYKLNNGTSDRFHVGFGAQSVEEAMTECGITDKEFAGLIKSPKADGDNVYGLRYSEFIALAVLEIQNLNNKITELEKRINGE